MPEAEKAIVKRWYDQFDGGKTAALAAVDELYAPDCVLHDARAGDVPGRAGLRAFVASVFDSLPDLEVALDDIASEGGKVMCRFTWRGTHLGEYLGVPPTRRRVVAHGISMARVQDGKIAEAWQSWDSLSVVQQLGVVAESTEDAKRLARLFFEDILNQRGEGLIEEIIDAGFVGHPCQTPEVRGQQGIKDFVTSLWTGFPDLRYTIEDLVAEGDKVVARWTFAGTQAGASGAPTGPQLRFSGTSTLRIAGGRIAEHWMDWDALGMMQQLGVFPQAGGAAA